MELKYIEAFLKVVEMGSFSEASSSMHISQPTISLRIQKLEQELNTVLFERNGGKKAVLTDAGKKLYPFYKEGLRSILKGNEVLQSGYRGVGRLRLSCPNHVGRFILPGVLKSLYEHFPDIEFNVNVSTTMQIVDDIKKGETDVGFIFLDSEATDESYTIIPIAMEKTVLVAAPHHPLVKLGPIKIKDLADEKFIVFAKASNKNIIIDRFFSKHGLKEYNTIEIKNLEWIKTMVNSGLGISFLQKSIVEVELQHRELEEIILTPPLPDTPISIIYRNDVLQEIQYTIIKTIKEMYRT
ncbi:LysR family transcriptional regulator [Paenibacillus abyssi]|uniref:HTH-type transcriptional regulator YwbI n=1 Tax=Paenibacillus abyssi TaxID=1340531 RepID=A0A917FND0_9BACL|nr:LysR family transcriptional regulator [Paenibacillus abyssi]GGF91017.1 putative HTH-type transcriptional regulator YwbI [Paenibacillus abyssi]